MRLRTWPGAQDLVEPVPLVAQLTRAEAGRFRQRVLELDVDRHAFGVRVPQRRDGDLVGVTLTRRREVADLLRPLRQVGAGGFDEVDVDPSADPGHDHVAELLIGAAAAYERPVHPRPPTCAR